jgi:monoamine oxidase
LETETLIIGGGLAGIALADALSAAGKDFVLVEARDRIGGRILNHRYGQSVFDMGPAWFWPGQLRIAALISRLGLERFEQFASGDILYEDQNGVQRGQGFASMEGSYRLMGGFGALVAALEKTVPSDRVYKGSPVTGLVRRGEKISAKTSDKTFTAQNVVLALPPRIAAEITFAPPLPDAAVLAMQNVQTWMAGQAKAVAVYDRPFWRDAGFSGDAMSRKGPMVEIHDASPSVGGPYALFGFIGVPPNERRDAGALRQQLIEQFSRLFGPEAGSPVQMVVKDWAFDPHTSTSADLAPLSAHPQYGLPLSLSELWQGSLLFAGSEVAPQFGGYLEGALEAAEIAFARLNKR